MSALSLVILGLLTAVPPTSCQQGERRAARKVAVARRAGLGAGLGAGNPGVDTCRWERGAETGVMEEPPKAETSEPDLCL